MISSEPSRYLVSPLSAQRKVSRYLIETLSSPLTASLASLTTGLAFLLSYLGTLFFQLGIHNIFLILVIGRSAVQLDRDYDANSTFRHVVYLLGTVLTCVGFLYQTRWEEGLLLLPDPS